MGRVKVKKTQEIEDVTNVVLVGRKFESNADKFC